MQLFGLCPAIVLQRLYDEEEDEAGEEMETDEMFKTYSIKKILAAQYPWKKSRWGKICPVALYEGNMTPGKAEYAVRYDNFITKFCTTLGKNYGISTFRGCSLRFFI